MDVYDEVDRRENDAGEPGGDRSLGQRGQRVCPLGRGWDLVWLWGPFTGTRKRYQGLVCSAGLNGSPGQL